MRCLAMLLLFVVAGVALAQQPQPPAAAVTMDDIKKAWQERQDKVKTLKMSWTLKRALYKGTLSLIPIDDNPNPKPEPPRDLILNGTSTLLLRQSEYRLNTQQEAWSIEQQRIANLERTCVQTLGVHTGYTSRIPDQSFGTSRILSTKRDVGDTESLELYPIWWHHRGCADNFSGSVLDSCELSGQYPVFQQVRCVELVRKSRNSGDSTRLWLNPNQGFAVVRYLVIQNSKTEIDLSVSYVVDPILGHKISNWKYVVSARGKYPGESVEYAVSDFHLNGDIEDSTFEIQYEPGTVVSDWRSGKESRYVVAHDGQAGVKHGLREKISQAELMAESNVRWWQKTHILVGIVLILFSGCWLLVRLKKKQKSNRTSST